MDFTRDFKFIYNSYKIQIDYITEITGQNFYCDPLIKQMSNTNLKKYFELFIGPEFEKLKRININRMILTEKFRRPYPYSYTGLYISNILSAPQYVGQKKLENYISGRFKGWAQRRMIEDIVYPLKKKGRYFYIDKDFSDALTNEKFIDRLRSDVQNFLEFDNNGYLEFFNTIEKAEDVKQLPDSLEFEIQKV